MRPLSWQIEADGEDLSGEYFLCEVMNIRSVGPTLELAPQADPADGFLDLVLVAEQERRALREYLDARIAGGETEAALPTRRVTRVTIMAAGAEVHIDDRLERPHEKPSLWEGMWNSACSPARWNFSSPEPSRRPVHAHAVGLSLF